MEADTPDVRGVSRRGTCAPAAARPASPRHGRRLPFALAMTAGAAPAGLTSGAAQARTGWVIELGADASAARAIQRCAAEAHVSQSAAGPQVRRRLDLLGGRERLRWLMPPAADSRAGAEPAAAATLPG
jgi:hypothetical protein